MGQIQNAITGAISAGIGAAITNEIRVDKKSKELVEASTSAPKLVEEAQALEDEAFKLEYDIEKTNNEIAQLNPKNPADRLKGFVLSGDIEMANRALKNVQRKQEANKLQRERVGKILGTTLETNSEEFSRVLEEAERKE